MADAHGERPTLEAQTLQSAIDLAEYFREQFWKVLPLIAGKPRGGSRSLVDSIRQCLSDGRRWSRTELQVTLGGHVNAHELSRALEELEASGEAIRIKGRSTGGRPPEFWQLNPDLRVPA
jgi:hypothetical protein